MRIDLHVHTNNNGGGSEKRIIVDPVVFKKILNEAKIGIMAITDHNEFDFEKYKSFQDNSFLLLPGVEYDVSIDDGKKYKRQLNIIWNPNKASIFSEKVKKVSSSPQNPTSLSKVIEEFDSDDTIFYLDYKSGKWSWRTEEADKLFEGVRGIVLFDANSAKTKAILSAYSYSSLIGSDHQDWSNYVEIAETLVNSNLKISSYEMFINLLKGNLIEDVEKQFNLRKIDLKIGGDKNGNNFYNINNLSIADGLNVIFGSKGTGKTEMLRSIYNNDSRAKVIYESKKYYEYFELITKSNAASDEDVLRGNKILEFLNYLKDYKEKYSFNFKHFLLAFNNSTKYKIGNSKITNITKGSYLELYNILKSANYIKQQVQSSKDLDTSEKESVSNGVNAISKTTIDKILKLERPYWISDLTKKILNGIQAILKKDREEVTVPNKIGLFELFEQRNNLRKKVEETISHSIRKHEVLQTFNIPEKGVVKLIKSVEIANISLEKPFQTQANYNGEYKGIVAFWKKVQTFVKNNKTNWTKPQLNEISKIKISEQNLSSWNYYYIYTFFENDAKKVINLSNGEEAFVALFSVLNQNYDAYYLDEPETFFGNKMISEELVNKIKELKISGKSIFMTSHRNTLGINTLPFNYIYRSNLYRETSNVYKTYCGNINRNELTEIETNEKLSLVEELIKCFEGSKEHFGFRKEIYNGN